MSQDGRRQIVAIMKSLEVVTARVVTKITLDITANLIASNVVITGWMRSNWLPSIGAPFAEPFGTRESVTAGPQQSLMVAILRYRLRDGTVYVANPVPYAAEIAARDRQVEQAIEKALTQDILGIATGG